MNVSDQIILIFKTKFRRGKRKRNKIQIHFISLDFDFYFNIFLINDQTMSEEL